MLNVAAPPGDCTNGEPLPLLLGVPNDGTLPAMEKPTLEIPTEDDTVAEN